MNLNWKTIAEYEESKRRLEGNDGEISGEDNDRGEKSKVDGGING